MGSAVLGQLVGRASERAALEAAVARAAGGVGAFVVIEGDAGIGKSRLVAEASVLASDAGFVVAHAVADELDRVRPFAAIERAISSTSAVVSADAPEDAYVSAVEQAALQQPIALLFDDLQWADASTVEALRAIAVAVADLPVLVVLAARPGPRLPATDALFVAVAAHGGELLVLQPLTDADAVELVGSDGTDLNRVAGGNPFLLLELATNDGDTDATGDVRDALRQRWRDLPASTMDLLRTVAVLGPENTLNDVASVLGRRATELLADIDAAIANGVLTSEGRVLRFRHDVLRTTLYDDIPTAIVAALHLQAARALREEGAPPVVVASHLIAGAQVGDMEAVATLRGAARSVERTSLPAAVDLLDEAARLAKPEPLVAAAAVAETVPLLSWTGHRDQAIARAMRLLNGPLPVGVEVELRRDLAEAFALDGRYDEAVDHAEAALAMLGDRVESEPQAARAMRCELEAIALAKHRHHPLAALAASTNIRERAEGAGAFGALAILAYLEAMVAEDQRMIALMVDRSEAAVRFARSAAGGDARGRSAARLLAALEIRGGALNLADRVTDAMASLEEAVRLATAMGSSFSAHLLAAIAVAACEMGDLDRCRTELEAVDDVEGTRFAALTQWLTLAVSVGDFATADDVWAEHLVQTNRLDSQLRVLWRGRQLVYQDQPAEALRLLRAEFERVSRSDGEPWMSRTGAFPLIRLARAAGDEELARRVAAEADVTLRVSPGIPTIGATALLAHGVVDRDAAIAAEAIERFRSVPIPWRLAAALIEQSHLLADLGSTSDACAAALEAAEVAATHGLYDEVVARNLVASLSSTRAPRRRQRPTSGWESITATEHKVIAALTEGLSNPQIAEKLFVSRHTVDSHLKHVFTKLGISSRVELAALAIRRGDAVTT